VAHYQEIVLFVYGDANTFWDIALSMHPGAASKGRAQVCRALNRWEAISASSASSRASMKSWPLGHRQAVVPSAAREDA
jgi:hypothetical protein